MPRQAAAAITQYVIAVSNFVQNMFTPPYLYTRSHRYFLIVGWKTLMPAKGDAHSWTR